MKVKKIMGDLNRTNDQLMSAIRGALEEEKVPQWKWKLKSFVIASLLAGCILTFLHWIWPDAVTHQILTATSCVWLLLLIALSLYFKPQPRLEVRGFWSTWTWGRLLMGMTLISLLQIAVCPDLAALSNLPNYLSSLTEPMTQTFMNWGGMSLCMFFCGLIFSGLAAGLVFLTVREAIAYAPKKYFLGIFAVMLLGQSPVILLQTMDAHARLHLPYWLMGSLTALLTILFLFRQMRFEKTN
ncbi:MAG: hypothetical protein J0L93_08405 [Deltaproteobacteria bacterium]|nr:hypothetical protein [Deltaproteobacteria bacterium]